MSVLHWRIGSERVRLRKPFLLSLSLSLSLSLGILVFSTNLTLCCPLVTDTGSNFIFGNDLL